ncbi:D-alanine--D-alanine ligase family protein [Pelolinea submarina]|uniref:D-alanine--D-alanine ligase n=1 Tax=Pelolinea submarina TaxID=913107 RepID=A0A347ZS22_9CHLR|nr:D-alanine--D-alanine ligase family protein [Pelolinea submarina]REG11332.1 D-alanine-D-alanine ligase [Pelolinea submarina]BBB48103.1 D-alanine-D-alanine ligase [Pelolinea submarina]
MTEKINLGIILGGRSGEHEVSLMSSRSVLSVLDREKFNVTEIGIDHNGLWWSGEHVLEALEKGSTQSLHRVFLLPEPGKTVLYKRSFENASEVITPIAELDVIFPVLHGTFGEDGTLQGFFEMADVAYVGAGVLGSSVGMDKSVFKDVMRANGIPVTEWITCTRRDIETNVESVIKRAEAVADYPLFVKPANLGSSVGITKVKNHSDLYEGILEAARYDRRILIERGINAREIEVSVLGNEDAQASLPGEIVPSDEFYSYNAKYLDGKSNLFIPAPLSDELTEKIRELAVKTYKAIDCAGMARVDFLLDKDTNDLYINEVNTIPGFTSISMYPKLWDAGGLTYPALIEKLIDLALERKQERNKSKRTFGD